MFYLFNILFGFMCVVYIAPAIVLAIIAIRANRWVYKTINQYYGTWLGACIYVMATQQVLRVDAKAFPTYSYTCCQLYINAYDQRKRQEGLTK